MRMGWKRPFLFAQIQLRRGFEDIYRLKTVQGLGFYPLIQDCSLNPEMERVLVEGTVKEARAPEANYIAQGSKTGPCP